MAVSMLLTYPTVPFTVYAKTDQGLKIEQEPKRVQMNGNDMENFGGVVFNQQDISPAASGTSVLINTSSADAKQAITNIATYVNEIPQVTGVTWANDVSESNFQTPFETVQIADSNGNTYTVEVVPKGLIYFIDSYKFSTDGTEVTSVPYTAIKNLVGNTLQNQVYDQIKTESNNWGLIEDEKIKSKGNLSETEVLDKNLTGIYRDVNQVGSELSYEFFLPAGRYTITTGHREWWGNGRSMDLKLTIDGTTKTYKSSFQVPGNETKQHSYTFKVATDQVVKFTATSTIGQAPLISWLAIAEAEEESTVEPTRPIDKLPSGYDQYLEDNDGLELSGASVFEATGYGNILKVAAGWNDQNQGHASIKDVANVFKKTAFTVLLDVKQEGDNNELDKRVAFTIGNASNSLSLLSLSDKFGYGNKPGGVISNPVALDDVDHGEWNSLAMTYKEESGKNGSVVIYVNGQKSAEISDIGFKLSEMNDLSAMVARSFNTNFLQDGQYDSLIVFDQVVDETTLCEETAWRKWSKEHTVNKAPLEAAVNKADALIAAGITSDGLASALQVAKNLLARTDLTKDDQIDLDTAAENLNKEYDKINPIDILIKGADVDAANLKKNGLTYKGFGMLNGNSTSNLLLDYKAEHPTEYWDMMEYLFGGEHPLFTHIKMEMGNDGNNSTGAEACTMRYKDDEADASRSPGFVMAADAKKINPDVKISILRWEIPKWVKDAGFVENKKDQAGWDAYYLWYKETIFDAYEKYGYVVDFINPDRNETGNPDEEFIKWFAKQIEEEENFPEYMDKDARDAYHKIRIIASDENKGLQIVPSMRNDTELYQAVDIIGFHYRTDATDDYVKMADVDNKEVWYSEGCATFGYSELQETKRTEYGYESIGGYQGPLALMDSFITAFRSSRRTHYVFQPAIGSFYEGIQYGHKELLSARDPWSGYIHYDPALHMLEHFAKFAKLGWENEDETNGIWVAVSQASKESFAGTSNEHATAGINGNAGYLTLVSPDKKDFSVVFVNNTQNQKTFRIKAEDLSVDTTENVHVWTTTSSENFLKNTADVQLVDGGWIVTLPPYSISTATTLEVTLKDAPADGIHNEDRDVLDTDETGRNVDTTDEYLYADNFDYTEEPAMEQYNVHTGTTTVDYLKARGNEPRYMLDTHGAWIVEKGRLKQELANGVGQWNGGEPATIVGDFRWMDYTAEVKVQIPDANSGVWAGLGIRTQTGMNWEQSGYTLRINGAGDWKLYRVGTEVGNGSVRASKDGSYTIALTGMDDTIIAIIDGEVVTTYQDSNPMLAGRVKFSSTWNQVYFDDFTVKKVEGGIPYALSMIDGQDPSIRFEGDWEINNPGGGSADDWYRTLSKGSAGSAFEFEIDGDGFAIIGNNDASVKLSIDVDNGKRTESNVAVTAVPKRYEAYSMSGLGMGHHKIKVTVESGTLKMDALYALGEKGEIDENTVEEVLTELPGLQTVFAEKGIASEELPESVEVRLASGETKILPVIWDNDTDKLLEYLFKETVITGTLEGGVNAAGYPVKVSIPVEVIPSDTLYFIDTVTNFKDSSGPSTTEPYSRISALLGDQLLNSVYDQLKEDGNTWGLVDRDAGVKSYDSTTDKTATGIYGKDNAAGETLSYALTLPAGEYTLYSEHREWWGMDRPMKASVTVDGKTLDAGTILLSGSSGDQFFTYDFVVEEEQVVTYTITATGTQAPVISWLAVSKKQKVDKTALEQAISEAEKLDPELYTEASYQAVLDALNVAKEVLADENAKQTEVNTAKRELNDAVKALQEKTDEVDKTGLELAITKAEEVDSNLYTEETYQALSDALEAARNVLADETADQAAVDQAKEDLENAINALEEKQEEPEPDKVDKTALEQAVAKAEKLDPELYTEASYQAVTDALEAAKNILADENAEQAAVDQAKEDLENAINALEEKQEEPDPDKADKAALEQAVAKAEKLDPELYTEASYQAVTDALEAAKNILADENAEQAAVDQAKEDLENAINALEEKQEEPDPDKADKAALEQAVAKAEKLDPELYTEASYQAVAEALKAAKNVLADENAKQAAVDQVKEDLENAINALEEKQEEPKPDKVDKTGLEEVIKQAEALDRISYTEISYQAVVKALEAAKAILADEKAEQAAVDQAKENLTKAIEALENKPIQPDQPDREEEDDDDSDDDIQQNFLTNREENLVEDALGTSSIKEVTENGSGKLVVSISSEVVFIEKNGTLSKNKWQQVDDSWYFFDKDSKAVDGWLEQNGKWYYLNEFDKKMETGWLRIKDGKWYLLDYVNGDMKTGWQQTKDGKWYLLDYVNGDMKTGWQQTKDGKWYLLDYVNGDMKTGWQQTKDGKWYLLDSVNGDMKTGWQMVKGIWYYLTKTGAMAENTITPDGYKVGKDGAWTGR